MSQSDEEFWDDPKKTYGKRRIDETPQNTSGMSQSDEEFWDELEQRTRQRQMVEAPGNMF